MPKTRKPLRTFFVVAETDEYYSRIETFIKGETVRKALDDFTAKFPPSGNALFPLSFADLYRDANAYHRGQRPLATLRESTSEYFRRESQIKPISMATDKKDLINPMCLSD